MYGCSSQDREFHQTVQTRAGPTLPAKQETSLWSAGVEAGEQVC